ncbi:LysR family transcriptional regulator [Roseovarius sp. LXJ103]|uniref:LysR substrate-binding domain-containing protein n=1 Tax=Roseovarius carneus TaxID=2853164 RepID=UPI000D61BFC6|nr:LysR substrate-binding domain-containing protein [Roseovarius carneus]MBZ8117048.1 LysR family transcriptional regulator [Roseovarius carneus]PWE37102.1 transcriptional regulator [Pelagicola sp. LXJ1103]
MSRIPSTQALRALECFARHGTVWAAADELNLTRSAVSHQLRLLERDLGFVLFNRVGTRIELTPRGRAYAGDVRGALSAIAGSAVRNAGHGLSGTLTVSCTPGFAAFWLAPRIGEFRTICPEVELRIVTPRRLDDVSNPEADIFISFGDGAMPGVDVELLQEVEFAPLLSPILANRLGGIKSPADILRADLLHLGDTDDWRRWMQAAGLPRTAATGPVFADMNLVYAATVAGQGVSMGDAFICNSAMASGQLIRVTDIQIKSSSSYFLGIPPQKQALEPACAFRRWISSVLPGAKR